MSDSTEISPDDLILAGFIRELDQLGVGQIDVERWASNHPHMEQRFLGLVNIHATLEDARQQEQPQIPKQLGEFKIERRIAQGGMGDVFEAVQTSLNRRVAVKTIRNAKLSPETEQRFLREQTILGELHQTHIVPIHTAGIEEGYQYFAMPFINGAALSHVVKKLGSSQSSRTSGKTPALGELACVETGEFHAHDQETEDFAIERTPAGQPPTSVGPNRLSATYLRSVAQVMADVADAIEHAHHCRILHRDIKPSNIMVDEQEQCWIIDFGLAKYLKEEFDAFAQTMTADEGDHFQTQAKALGTPAYMAPEQFEGQADVRTDIYGLGVTLYELLTLRRAYNGESFEEFKRAIKQTEPPKPHTISPGLPADLEAICLKAMHKNPGHRYQTAADFATDLRRYLNGEPVAARPAWVLRRVWKWARRNKGWASAIGLFVILLFGGVGFRELELRRNTILQNAEKQLTGNHFTGWVTSVRTELNKASMFRAGNEESELYCGTLAGIDASMQQSWNVFGNRIAFNQDETKLLVGQLHRGVTLVDLDSDRETFLQGLSEYGGGPVGFDSSGHPLRLVANSPRQFQVEDLQLGKLIATFESSNTETASATDTVADIDKANRLAKATPDLSRAVVWSKGGDPADGNATSGTILVWDRESGKVVREIRQNPSALAVSVNGELIAIGNEDGSVQIQDVDKMTDPMKINASTRPIAALDVGFKPEFSTTGDGAERVHCFLAVADVSGAVSIWDLSKGIPVMLQRQIVHHVNSVKIKPDGTMVAAASHHGIQLWDIFTGQLLLRFEYTSRRHDLAFSPDGSKLAVPGELPVPTDMPANQVGTQVWELYSHRGIRTLRGIPFAGVKTEFSEDGRQLAALSNDWTIGIWDVEKEQMLHRLQAPPGWFVDNSALLFSPDAKRFWFAAGGVMTEWDLTTGRISNQWNLPLGLQDRVAVTPDGRLLLMRWDFEARQSRLREMLPAGASRLIWEDAVFDRRIVSIEGTRDGRCFVLDGESSRLLQGSSRQIAIVNGQSGTLERMLVSTSRNPNSVTPIAREAGFFLQRVQVDNESPGIRVPFQNEGPADELPWVLLAVSPDGKYGYWHDNQNVVELYDLHEQKVLFRYPNRTEISLYQQRFSPDGKRVAWANVDGTVNVCEIDRVLKELKAAGFSWSTE